MAALHQPPSYFISFICSLEITALGSVFFPKHFPLWLPYPLEDIAKFLAPPFLEVTSNLLFPIILAQTHSYGHILDVISNNCITSIMSNVRSPCLPHNLNPQSTESTTLSARLSFHDFTFLTTQLKFHGSILYPLPHINLQTEEVSLYLPPSIILNLSLDKNNSIYKVEWSHFKYLTRNLLSGPSAMTDNLKFS